MEARDRPKGKDDPTENVLALVEAANRRQDDLRSLTKELFDAKAECLKEIGDMRETHQAELRRAEVERQNAVRLIDREDVNKTALQSQSSINSLLATFNSVTETLRNQRSMDTSELSKRISAVEASQATGSGQKQGSVAMWGYIAAGFSFFLTLLAISGALFAFLK